MGQYPRLAISLSGRSVGEGRTGRENHQGNTAAAANSSQACSMLGFNQPKISALKQGKLSGYSIKRLMRFLLVLPPKLPDCSLLFNARSSAGRSPASVQPGSESAAEFRR